MLAPGALCGPGPAALWAAGKNLSASTMASRRAGATGAAACAHNGGGDDDIDDEACLLALAQAERDAENRCCE